MGNIVLWNDVELLQRGMEAMGLYQKRGVVMMTSSRAAAAMTTTTEPGSILRFRCRADTRCSFRVEWEHVALKQWKVTVSAPEHSCSTKKHDQTCLCSERSLLFFLRNDVDWAWKNCTSTDTDRNVEIMVQYMRQRYDWDFSYGSRRRMVQRVLPQLLTWTGESDRAYSPTSILLQHVTNSKRAGTVKRTVVNGSAQLTQRQQYSRKRKQEEGGQKSESRSLAVTTRARSSREDTTRCEVQSTDDQLCNRLEAIDPVKQRGIEVRIRMGESSEDITTNHGRPRRVRIPVNRYSDPANLMAGAATTTHSKTIMVTAQHQSAKESRLRNITAEGRTPHLNGLAQSIDKKPPNNYPTHLVARDLGQPSYRLLSPMELINQYNSKAQTGVYDRIRFGRSLADAFEHIRAKLDDLDREYPLQVDEDVEEDLLDNKRSQKYFTAARESEELIRAHEKAEDEDMARKAAYYAGGRKRTPTDLEADAILERKIWFVGDKEWQRASSRRCSWRGCGLCSKQAYKNHENVDILPIPHFWNVDIDSREDMIVNETVKASSKRTLMKQKRAKDTRRALNELRASLLFVEQYNLSTPQLDRGRY